MNTPQSDEALQWFTALSTSEQGRFLAALAHNLTIGAWCFFNAFEPDKSDVVRARAMNELLHKATSYLQRLHAGKGDSAWAPTLIQRLLEQDDPVLLLQIAQAWHYAVESTDARQAY